MRLIASFDATKVTEASFFSDLKGSLTIASQRKNMVKKANRCWGFDRVFSGFHYVLA
jgi:hypothetical protein